MSPRRDLEARTPWMNAAGSLGFAPPAGFELGAFVTNPISLNPRTPANPPALIPFEGGVLLHTGLPNPGLRDVLRRHGPRWQRSSVPLWVHLIGTRPDEIYHMARLLEEREEVATLEIGLPPDAAGSLALEMISAAAGELPVAAALGLTQALQPWAADLARMGASAVTLSAPRGSLLNEAGGLTAGRLYGPALLPLTFEALRRCRDLELPLIAGAGIYSKAAGQAVLDAGAWAVQLDTVLWKSEHGEAAGGNGGLK